MVAAALQTGERVRAALRRGVRSTRTLMTELETSQPSLSRAMRALGEDVVQVGRGRSIQYALRDATRQELQAPVYRVSAAGQVRNLGTLIPVHSEGFVMEQADGVRLHTEGLPWWLYDMRPQGYLGRAYVSQHGNRLGLPARLDDWHDAHVLRALLLQGDDLPGNLLIGDRARDLFVNTPEPQAIPNAQRPAQYVALAAAASRGELHGSSAGGEQPKFTAFAETDAGPAHVIVKFSAASDNAVSERWRDLLLAEHTALEVLRAHGMAAAHSTLIDHGNQRFLEVCRFDREGALGRRALFSVMALDAEFAGTAGNWPQVVRALARERVVEQRAIELTEVLWAFGVLIANTDMHGGNLSFMAEHGRPYQIAPAYDMTCMAFAPTTGGDLPVRDLQLSIDHQVAPSAWLRALPMATDFLERLQRSDALSNGFSPCLTTLTSRIQEASARIERLADL